MSIDRKRIEAVKVLEMMGWTFNTANSWTRPDYSLSVSSVSYVSNPCTIVTTGGGSAGGGSAGYIKYTNTKN
jgi:hypothetical protein